MALTLGCGASETAPAKKADTPPTDTASSSTDGPGADGPGADGSGDFGPGDAASSDGEPVAAASGPFVLGDLIEPFDPPTLEELEKSVKWVDQPVVDTLKLLREHKAKEPKPEITAAEALAMKNDSAEANEKILSALSVLAPEDGAGVDYDATIRRAIMQECASLNPILTSSMSESEFLGLTGFGLFGFDWEFNPLASADSVVSWQSSEDGLYDKVVLRDDLTWSDGKPITAHDVEFSYRVIMSQQVPVPAMRSGTTDIRLVKAYDDHTLVYFHKKPLATNVWNVNFAIIPKHIYAESIADDPTLKSSRYHANLEENPVTGGAYELASRTRGTGMVLKRRESYYLHNGKQVREKPYFKQIRLRIIEDQNTSLLALKAGQIDDTRLGAEQWLTQTDGADFYDNNTKVRGEEWTFFYVAWNLADPLFEDVRVRRAMAHAMDYEEMLDDLCFGLYQRCYGPFSKGSWMYPENPAPLYEFDLDKAEDLLDEAGWVDDDGDGVREKVINGRKTPFEFTLLVSNKPDRIAICNLLRENLEYIGVVCKIQPLEAAVFQERMFKKQFQAEMAGWGAGADPSTSKNIFATGEDRNYGSYSNKEVDRLFDEGEREFDREKRAEIYGKIANLIYEDQPYTFLYEQSSFFGFNKRLRGYKFSPRGPFSYGPGFSSIWMPVQ
jgi:peptide/nickel transport system substrate-binding protein